MNVKLVKLFEDLEINEDILISLSKEEVIGRILEALATLTETEAEIMKMRLGLYDNKPYTRVKITQIKNVSIDVVRNIELKARRKLRHPLRRQILLGTASVDKIDTLLNSKEQNLKNDSKRMKI